MRRIMPVRFCHSERSEESRCLRIALRFFVPRNNIGTQNDKGCRNVALVFCLTVLFLCILTGGCSTNEKQRLSFEQRLSAPYDQTKIKEGLTLDVLPLIQRSPDEIGRAMTEPSC